MAHDPDDLVLIPLEGIAYLFQNLLALFFQ